MDVPSVQPGAQGCGCARGSSSRQTVAARSGQRFHSSEMLSVSDVTAGVFT